MYVFKAIPVGTSDLRQGAIAATDHNALETSSTRLARQTDRVQRRTRPNDLNFAQGFPERSRETTESVGTSARGGVQDKKSTMRHRPILVSSPVQEMPQPSSSNATAVATNRSRCKSGQVGLNSLNPAHDIQTPDLDAA